MKMVGKYTLRGKIKEGTANTQRIPLFDGKFDTAYKVVKFVIAPERVDDSSGDCAAKLMTENTGINADFWNWNDMREVGWASTNVLTADGVQKQFSEIDPDNLIIEDLYITTASRSTENNSVNYLVVMEKYDISEYQGALSMVRNRSQG